MIIKNDEEEAHKTENMAYPICKKCVHYKKKLFFAPVCNRPVFVQVDTVSGKTVSTMQKCVWHRSGKKEHYEHISKFCGIEGTFFKEKTK